MARPAAQGLNKGAVKAPSIGDQSMIPFGAGLSPFGRFERQIPRRRMPGRFQVASPSCGDTMRGAALTPGGRGRQGGTTMLRFEGKNGPKSCDGLTRRDFLQAGALGAGAVGLSLADLERLHAAGKARDTRCILLFLVGGPSQLDTWDLKPKAPS